MKYTLTAAALLVLSPALFAQNKDSWFDNYHESTSQTLDGWARSIDGWIAEPDPDRPATANLRFMLDNQWNRYDGYSIKPRVRAKIRLPSLKKRWSLVIGDDDLDNQNRDKTNVYPNYHGLEKERHYDRQQARNDNASVALRWSNFSKSWGVDTDADIGLRARGDLYLRLKANKEWRLDDVTTTRLEQIYRYGAKSRHYARTNFEVKRYLADNFFVANHLFLDYRHNKKDESLWWGNSLYGQHHFANHKRLNYGVLVGGPIRHKAAKLNGYGPFVSWRQPIYRDWLFLQTELNYYNNKELDRSHHLGGFMRLEVIF
ncbi:hypothetical protein A4G20_10870 [Pasteurellaceae bacterium RH1A]|nr:hypothetical protein A4G20_10870 [Pasteurellaceae bacterium RH1A]